MSLLWDYYNSPRSTGKVKNNLKIKFWQYFQQIENNIILPFLKYIQ